MSPKAEHYAASGVDFDAKEAGLAGLVAWVRKTFENNPRAPVSTAVGHYAAVLSLRGLPVDLAISTDGVGTKVLVAEMANRYETIGIDCVAMNANDLVCVGAEPLAMVDYLAVERADPQTLEAIGRGLAEGARRAEISIPGGELALMPQVIRGIEEGRGCDLVGSCVGLLEKGALVDGSRLAEGDAVVGIDSSGLHSNGFSLARRVVFETLGRRIDDPLEECGRSVADELLEPTAMYVREAKALLAGGVDVKALFHVTGGGLLNLRRSAAAGLGIHVHDMPEPPPVFSLIQEAGGMDAAEMHSVFNMGVGFVVVVPPTGVDAVTAAARAEGKAARVIGRVVADPERRVVVERPGSTGCLVSAGECFVAEPAVPAEHAR